MEQRHRRKKIEVSEEKRDFLEEELNVEFRLFLLSDIEEIMKIEESSFKNDSYSKSRFIKLYEEHPKEFFVATIFGKIVGYVVGYISDGIGEIDSLTVDSCYRHLGIGKKLIMLIFKKFREKGISEFSLEVRSTNEDAIQFYKNLGFQIIETIKGFYNDKGDAYLMRMHVAEV